MATRTAPPMPAAPPALQPTAATIAGYYAAMRRFWHPVLPSASLVDGAPQAVTLLEEEIVLARLNGQVVAMQDLCRHFQAKLSLGEVRRIPGAGDCLMCPYHGWSYDIQGRCVDIPQLTPDRQIPADAVVPTYLAAERYGLVWVCLDDSPRFGIPEFPLVDDPAFLTGPLRAYPAWQASAPRVIMAALDDTHGPWVHAGLVGDRENPLPPEHVVSRNGRNLVVRVKMIQPSNPTIAEPGQGPAHGRGPQEVHLTTTVGIPNTIHFTIQAKGSARATLIWQAVCPVRYNETRTFWGSSRNYDHDQPVYNPEFEAMQDTLREQDRVIVESQRPWLLPPFWTKLELPLRPADLPLIEYQRWLEELDVALAL
jgi:phenylpropionate dioxygenase-like ring-hydroxylating dioxygenase large terminal subunit